MTSKPRVQRAAHAEDRPRGSLLASVAVVALTAGALTGVTLAPRDAQPEPAPQPSASIAASEPQAPVPTTAEPEAPVPVEIEPAPVAAIAKDAGTRTLAPAPAAEPAPVSTPTPEPTPEPAAAPAPAPSAAPAASREDADGFVRGRIAYLRCDGLATRGGPFPCPRDRELERAVWKALQGAPRCALLTPGALELRIEIEGTHAPSFELRAPDRERARTAQLCLGDAFAGIGTSLAPERMVVSFTFELRGGAQ